MDRVALAFLSGVSTLLLAAPLWFAAGFAAAQFELAWRPSFAWVVGTSVLMAVLGFVLLENLVANALSALLRWTIDLFRVLAP